MKRSKGPVLALSLVLLALVLGGLFVLMGGDDDRRVHRELGRKINAVKLDGFDRFWACAFEGEDPDQLKSNTDLSYELTRRAEEIGPAYVQHIRTECMPFLDDIQPELDVLIVHDAELKADVTAMSSAAGDLRSAWKALITYIDNPSLEYDEAVVDGHVSKIARAWYEFRKASADANQLLKKHLTGE